MTLLSELYQIMGPESAAGVVARLEGWYQPPGGAVTPFTAESAVSVTALPDVGEGAWAELETADASVVLVRYPRRALDGLTLETLSALDLAYSFAWTLGYTAEVRWALAR